MGDEEPQIGDRKPDKISGMCNVCQKGRHLIEPDRERVPDKRREAGRILIYPKPTKKEMPSCKISGC